ncbi:MAG: oxidoreductase [Chloroflexi bacterium]|nr:oxidoreductase [Chloroflexota bacterium]
MKFFTGKLFWLIVYLALVSAPLVVLLIGEHPGGSGFWLDFSIALGYAGMAMVGIQFVLTARFRRATLPFGIDIIYYFHRYLAIVAFVLIVAHVAILMVDNPVLLANPNPLTAPWYVTIGIVSLFLFGLVIALSIWRKQLKIHYDQWRLWHGWLSVAAVITAVLHIEFIGYYIQTPWKRVLWTVITLSWILIFLYVRLLKPWLIKRKPYRIVSVTPERGDSWTLTIEADGHQGINFMPGQFAWINLRSSPFSEKEHPFSFSSSAEQPQQLGFTIKELGDFSSTIKDMKPGEVAYLDGPYGAFSPDRHSDAPGYIFIAGGIGGAPMMSMLRTLAERGDQRPLTFFYGNNHWDNVIFREELEELQTQMPNLKVIFLLSYPPDDWTGEVGYLNMVVLERHLPPRFQQFHCFICGPTAMIDMAEEALHMLHVSPHHVHSEIFDMV